MPEARLAIVGDPIDARSIGTRETNRDDHLRSADFLDDENCPALTFASSVSGEGSRWKVNGDLTIRGITRPVVLDVEFGGVQIDGDVDRAFFSATTQFDRGDFGPRTPARRVRRDSHVTGDRAMVRRCGRSRTRRAR